MKVLTITAALLPMALAVFGAVPDAHATQTKTFVDVYFGVSKNQVVQPQTLANSFCKAEVKGTVLRYQYLGTSPPRSNSNAEAIARFGSIVCAF